MDFWMGIKNLRQSLTETLLGGDIWRETVMWLLSTLNRKLPLTSGWILWLKAQMSASTQDKATCFHSQRQMERSLSLKVSAFKRTIGLWGERFPRLWDYGGFCGVIFGNSEAKQKPDSFDTQQVRAARQVLPVSALTPSLPVAHPISQGKLPHTGQLHILMDSLSATYSSWAGWVFAPWHKTLMFSAEHPSPNLQVQMVRDQRGF